MDQVARIIFPYLLEVLFYMRTSAEIELRPEGGVERSLGKAKRVLDRRS